MTWSKWLLPHKWAATVGIMATKLPEKKPYMTQKTAITATEVLANIHTIRMLRAEMPDEMSNVLMSPM